MPFTAEEFFAVFAAYNRALWPLPLVTELLGLLAAALLLVRPPWASRAVAGILAILWLLVGGGYHLAFFTAINPMAHAFGAMFLVQGALLAWTGAWQGAWRLEPVSGAQGWLAGLLGFYALVVYPLMGLLATHPYPGTPLFGMAPCPTAIFTLAVLLLSTDGPPWRLTAIPLAWAGIGGSAAMLLGVLQDYGLIVAGLLVLGATLHPSGARTAS
ncbi:DUF6064 family protein [Thiohalorhabdus methylotrophus]|uniref:DUF6064 family protein n=1 Tax=Thiohalorhabdus methylotrophus TaxID=3242694 RepID=A0ABV4TUI7_9GAMM